MFCLMYPLVLLYRHVLQSLYFPERQFKLICGERAVEYISNARYTVYVHDIVSIIHLTYCAWVYTCIQSVESDKVVIDGGYIDLDPVKLASIATSENTSVSCYHSQLTVYRS